MNLEIDPESWTFTTHALRRILEMCIPPDVIREVLENPERTYGQTAYSKRDERFTDEPRRVLCKGILAIVVNPVERRVITVLWDEAKTGDLNEDVRNNRSRIWDQGGWVDF